MGGDLIYGAEIVELTDMEPYQSVADDSCASDVTQTEQMLKQELMTTIRDGLVIAPDEDADLGIAPDEDTDNQLNDGSAASKYLVNAACVAMALLFATLV
jgi:hypothetical protein